MPIPDVFAMLPKATYTEEMIKVDIADDDQYRARPHIPAAVKLTTKNKNHINLASPLQNRVIRVVLTLHCFNAYCVDYKSSY